MTQPKNKTWEERFEKEFGHHGEIWNGKKGLSDELELKSFLKSEIQKAEKRGREQHHEMAEVLKCEICIKQATQLANADQREMVVVAEAEKRGYKKGLKEGKEK